MKTILRSDELSCPTCVNNIEKALNNLEGVEDAKVHFNTGRIEVEHDPQTTDEQTLLNTVENTGYKAEISAF
mgnify:CR=1 FL=1